MNRMVRGLLVLGGLLLLGCVVLYVFVIKPDIDAQEGEFGALRAACSGQAVAGAGSYPPASGQPKLISFDRFTEGGELSVSSHASSLEQAKWKAGSLAETSLVLCLGDSEQKLIEECEYEDDKFLNRYRFEQQFELREASSGDLVDEETLQGEEPEICDPKVAFGTQKVIEREGDKVTTEQLTEWVRPFIEEPQD